MGKRKKSPDGAGKPPTANDDLLACNETGGHFSDDSADEEDYERAGLLLVLKLCVDFAQASGPLHPKTRRALLRLASGLFPELDSRVHRRWLKQFQHPDVAHTTEQWGDIMKPMSERMKCDLFDQCLTVIHAKGHAKDHELNWLAELAFESEFDLDLMRIKMTFYTRYPCESVARDKLLAQVEPETWMPAPRLARGAEAYCPYCRHKNHLPAANRQARARCSECHALLLQFEQFIEFMCTLKEPDSPVSFSD